MTDKALLFINGVPPEILPDHHNYSLIACSDGAFNYLIEKGFPLQELDFISGDFDSHPGKEESLYRDKFIFTPDQDKTDFEKSLEIIKSRGYKVVDVYGASGGEMDHFLGNLTVAFHFINDLTIHFFDDYSTYYFSPKNLVLEVSPGSLVSLFPFPTARKVTTKGLKWALNGEDLQMTGRIGTRNIASATQVKIQFESGNLVVFVGKTKQSEL